ncbi:hypothetical protein [Nocardia sp. NPDC048505]|uniref:hypothetical protein n=1 Tax=unclassified Nocardia TaxID=2637762 RepID=UPI0033FF9AAA
MRNSLAGLLATCQQHVSNLAAGTSRAGRRGDSAWSQIELTKWQDDRRFPFGRKAGDKDIDEHS